MEKQWLRIRYFLIMGKYLGFVCATLGMLTLLGYATGFDCLYRPLTDGPATHPLTALVSILLGMSIGLYARHPQRPLFYLLPVTCAVISLTNIFDTLTGLDITAYITPFHSTVLAEIQSGQDNIMGLNTACMLLTLSLSILLGSRKRIYASQVVAFAALAFPTISITGYVYGIETFYGQMSLFTTGYGLFLSIGALSLNANVGGVRALLSPYIGGEIARIQIVLGYIVPFLLGYVFVQTLINKQSLDIFGIFVVAICWFIILLVTFSAIMQEKTDRVRRKIEREQSYAAAHDALTGLPNRRKFTEASEHDLLRAARSSLETWLLMIDLDHFKRINDLGGHQAGDRVLVAVANILENSIRITDRLCRLGGEEFAILLTDTDSNGASRVSEAIRHSIQWAEIKGYTDIHGPITTSIGMAYALPGDTLEALMTKADRALYAAKNQGRNRVVCSQE
ncbi:GGDEF domain-containing protein [Neptunicella sp. SCSIO 80796]|uniref:GGDEF domain-containing protein n=1 Tax=Neptunicella plasticusilytica TaxID=3117012 RepID=UPI003A4DBF67